MENVPKLLLISVIVILLLLIAAVCYSVYGKNKQTVLSLQEEVKDLRNRLEMLSGNFERFYGSFFSSFVGKQIRYSNHLVESIKDEVSDMEENIITNSCMIKQLKDNLINASEIMLSNIQVLDCKIESMMLDRERSIKPVS
ncbi:hypothetical protein C1I72_01060 [Ehrlichia canis]|uniref:hypothetical protein n=1 Tax=Ehrlichia canis TaxID=944 RepID=UPI000C846820|nr:hypothetical protein [Ehrlichia canis]AUO54493.1 hypothetical protein C1I72_01060 [Ehrlichia canis]